AEVVTGMAPRAMYPAGSRGSVQEWEHSRREDRTKDLDKQRRSVGIRDRRIQQRIQDLVDAGAAVVDCQPRHREGRNVPQLLVEEPGVVVVDELRLDLPRLGRADRAPDLEDRRDGTLEQLLERDVLSPLEVGEADARDGGAPECSTETAGPAR